FIVIDRLQGHLLLPALGCALAGELVGDRGSHLEGLPSFVFGIVDLVLHERAEQRRGDQHGSSLFSQFLVSVGPRPRSSRIARSSVYKLRPRRASRRAALALLAASAASCRPGAVRGEESPAEELDRLVLQDFPLPNPRLEGPASADLE